jgi:hypothetical protein
MLYWLVKKMEEQCSSEILYEFGGGGGYQNRSSKFGIYF